MAKQTNHINRDFNGLNIRHDQNHGLHQWRLVTPTGEKTYRTQEQAIQARIDYCNAVGFFDRFLLQLKPTKTTKTRRYEVAS